MGLVALGRAKRSTHQGGAGDWKAGGGSEQQSGATKVGTKELKGASGGGAEKLDGSGRGGGREKAGWDHKQQRTLGTGRNING